MEAEDIMRDDLKEALLKKLRENQPAKVRAFDGDDDEQPRVINVSKSRKRWGAVLDAIDGAPWTKLELLAADKSILGYFVNDEAIDDSIELTGAAKGRATEVAAIVKIVLAAQKQVIGMRETETGVLLGSLSGVVKEMSAAIRDLGKLYQEQVRAVEEAADARVEMQKRDWVEQLGDIAEAAPHLAPVVGQLLGQLRGAVTGKPAS
jgi:hypothetical protein